MIVVTGATGGLGRATVEGLLARGVPAERIAAVVRAPERAADLAALGVQVRRADYTRPETLAPAFGDAEKLLFVSSTGPDEARVAQHRAVVAAATEARVGLLAYTSVFAADTSPLALAEVHRDTERAIAESGLPSVLLRNGWYTENHAAGLPRAVDSGVLLGSAGEGRVAFAARADYAEAAATVLTRDDQAGKVHELTGDTAYGLADLAAEAASLSGRPVGYEDLAPERYAELLGSAGVPDFGVALLVDADLRIAEGALATVTGDLAELLGRPTTPPSVTIANILAAA
ncbi:NAD(P)H-binding protein [Streptomyces profundus]|uniref:NAD(P)H-binding protein n=1 Tax=Streptomyces profundus TaxID=2867410 RepID=UPI001D16D2DD|nr:NAD(P)H-binding protein [Streptomyces sp. MA3_2.13]UED83839.1 NAD(P)H-binding protein [Streptomyces sp. MA3_2.13]